MATFIPKESFDVLVNPGMGFCTFHSFNDDAINENSPRGSIAYFRLFWDEYEPEEGRFRFDVIDTLLQRAKENGQMLELGFKAMGTTGNTTPSWSDPRLPPLVTGKLPKPYRVPDWYFNLKPKGVWFEDMHRPPRPDIDSKLWEPHYCDPLFLEKHGNLLRAIGKRYDGHPQLHRIDIGSVGAFGEWNCYGVPHPSWEARQILIDTYFEAFPRTLKTIVLGDKRALKYTIMKGGGWAAHCLGDMRDKPRFIEFPKGGRYKKIPGSFQYYNHMEDVYMQRICEVKGTRVWRRAPVMFEACGEIQNFYTAGWGIDYIFAFALAMHGSIVNNLSKPIPDEWRPAVEDFQRKLGYRFVLREVECPDRLKAGETGEIKLRLENRGVAPCYRPYDLAIRFTHESTGRTHIVKSDTDTRRWLPGIHRVTINAALPADFPVGATRCDLALLSPYDSTPAIRFANDGRRDDGWHTLGGVAIDPCAK